MIMIGRCCLGDWHKEVLNTLIPPSPYVVPSRFDYFDDIIDPWQSGRKFWFDGVRVEESSKNQVSQFVIVAHQTSYLDIVHHGEKPTLIKCCHVAVADDRIWVKMGGRVNGTRPYCFELADQDSYTHGLGFVRCVLHGLLSHYIHKATWWLGGFEAIHLDSLYRAYIRQQPYLYNWHNSSIAASRADQNCMFMVCELNEGTDQYLDSLYSDRQFVNRHVTAGALCGDEWY